jgi:hypothetical protein
MLSSRPPPPPLFFCVGHARYEYRLDYWEGSTSSPWVPTLDDWVQLDNVTLEITHNFSIRAVAWDSCGGNGTTALHPVAMSSWFEYGPPPGSPAFVSRPLATVTSSYADFVFNCSTLPELTALQYTLDDSTWSGCGTSLTLGPLSSGLHTLRVRCVDETGAIGTVTNESAAIQYQWEVVTRLNSTISLRDLRNGPHNLTIIATDVMNHREAAPRT